MNYTNISPGCVFIISPPQKISAAVRDAQEVQDYLSAQNIPSLHVGNITPSIEHTDLNAINVQASYMAMCRAVVSVQGWEENTNCVKLVNIARILGKEVVHSSAIASHIIDLK